MGVKGGRGVALTVRGVEVDVLVGTGVLVCSRGGHGDGRRTGGCTRWCLWCSCWFSAACKHTGVSGTGAGRMLSDALAAWPRYGEECDHSIGLGCLVDIVRRQVMEKVGMAVLVTIESVSTARSYCSNL